MSRLTDSFACPGCADTSVAHLSMCAHRQAVPVPSKDNAVHHPAHYASGAIECIDAIEVAIEGLSGADAFNTGQVVKYLWRWNKKHSEPAKKLEDLKKARWYLDRLIVDASPKVG